MVPRNGGDVTSSIMMTYVPIKYESLVSFQGDPSHTNSLQFHWNCRELLNMRSKNG